MWREGKYHLLQVTSVERSFTEKPTEFTTIVWSLNRNNNRATSKSLLSLGTTHPRVRQPGYEQKVRTVVLVRRGEGEHGRGYSGYCLLPNEVDRLWKNEPTNYGKDDPYETTIVCFISRSVKDGWEYTGEWTRMGSRETRVRRLERRMSWSWNWSVR